MPIVRVSCREELWYETKVNLTDAQLAELRKRVALVHEDGCSFGPEELYCDITTASSNGLEDVELEVLD